MSSDFLEHYGVKGMRWGVRDASVATGSSKLPPSDDAVAVRNASAKLKKGGVTAVSNKELQAIVTRMNLEQQYSRLNPSKSVKALGLVSGILGVGTTVNQAIAFVNSPAGKAIKDALIKK